MNSGSSGYFPLVDARWILPVIALMAQSCGSDGPPPYGYYGYPSGYACRDAYDCSTGMSCVERQGGTCWPLCRTDYDCAAGLVCRNVPRHGADGHDDVCVPN